MLFLQINHPILDTLMEWLTFHVPFFYFSRCNFLEILFSESGLFSFHIQPLSQQPSVTNSRTYPQAHILITNWLSSVMDRLYK